MFGKNTSLNLRAWHSVVAKSLPFTPGSHMGARFILWLLNFPSCSLPTYLGQPSLFLRHIKLGAALGMEHLGLMGCWHHRKWLNLLWHNASPT